MTLASLDRSTAVPGRAPRSARLIQLAVVVPTLNERDNIVPLLAGLRAALDGIAWEVIFVDDGSTDGTPEAIAEIGRADRAVRLIRRHGRRGLSSAVTEGALATTAPIVAVIDADGQHDEAILPQLFEAVAGGTADIAVGTRYAAGGSIGDLDRRRSHISWFATKAAVIVTGTRLSDPMGGFFVVRHSCLLAALPRLSGTGFKILLDLLASSPEPLSVVELPYRFRRRTAGISKLDSLVTLQFVSLLIEKRIGHLIPIRLLMFLSVGALGLVIHLAALRLLLWGAGTSFNTAQTIAVIAAIAFNFALNNIFTYRDQRLRGTAIFRGLASFYLVCGLGALANIGIADLIYSTEHRWWIAGIAGATIGAVWNYAASSFLTWNRK
jgi:dolichol-phosphate mannosyltransferase